MNLQSILDFIEIRKPGLLSIVVGISLIAWQALTVFVTAPYLKNPVDVTDGNVHVRHYQMVNPGPTGLSDVYLTLDFPSDIISDKDPRVSPCSGLREDISMRRSRRLVFRPIADNKMEVGRVLGVTLTSLKENLPQSSDKVSMEWAYGKRGLDDSPQSYLFIWLTRFGLPLAIILFGIILVLKKPRLPKTIRMLRSKLETAVNNLTRDSNGIAKESLKQNLQEAIDLLTSQFKQE